MKVRTITIGLVASAVLAGGLVAGFVAPQAQATGCTQNVGNPYRTGANVAGVGGHSNCTATTTTQTTVYRAILIGTNPIVGRTSETGVTKSMIAQGTWVVGEYYTQTNGPVGQLKSTYITFNS